jgi:hypothetical protein
MSTIPAIAQDERFEWDQQSEEQLTPEPHVAVMPKLIRKGMWTLALLGVGVLAVCELHYWTLRSEINKKQASKVNAQLMATQLRDARLLNRYQWVKQSDGVLRIPESQAVSLVIADYSRQSPQTEVTQAAERAGNTRVATAGVP